MFRNFLRVMPLEAAAAHAVGGAFELIGGLHRKVLDENGLRDGNYLIDVGCGSGRTANALRDMTNLRYLGIDVVPEMVEYARRLTSRPDWTFTVVNGLSIPEHDCQADFVIMFSVLTHLSPREGLRYVTDAIRVIKPGGRLIASFLDPSVALHRRAAGHRLDHLRKRLLGWDVKNQMLRQEQIAEWAAALGLAAAFHGPEHFGQSFVVLTK